MKEYNRRLQEPRRSAKLSLTNKGQASNKKDMLQLMGEHSPIRWEIRKLSGYSNPRLAIQHLYITVLYQKKTDLTKTLHR